MFHVSLVPPSTSGIGPSRVKIERADYQSLVMEACGLLAETDCCFHVGGFGQDDWNLDVAYDMSSVIEQLPEVVSGLRSNHDVELDLYTPGVERTVRFAVLGDAVEAYCRSRTSWVPTMPTERLAHSIVLSMFERLAIDFARAASAVAPNFADIAPFDRWRLGDAQM
jgi:hypothetical protein